MDTAVPPGDTARGDDRALLAFLSATPSPWPVVGILIVTGGFWIAVERWKER